MLGDLVYTMGVNRFIFHRYAMQPWTNVYPGMTMGQWGFMFERTNTWFEQSRAWISYVARWTGPVERTGRATVLVPPGRADGVRRWADEVTPGPDGDVLTLRYAEPDWFAAWLVGYGSDVVVLDPPEVRDAAVARLRRIALAKAPEANVPEANAPGPVPDPAGVG